MARQVMLRPESVAKSEIWLRAASASYWTENMQEWIAEQSPKVRHACGTACWPSTRQ